SMLDTDVSMLYSLPRRNENGASRPSQEPAMNGPNSRLPAEVRLARMQLARRVVEELKRASNIRTLEPRPSALDAWMRANERSTRRCFAAAADGARQENRR